MEAYVAKLQRNMRKFLESGHQPTSEEKLAFIRQQYALLDITVKVINGKVYFVGCSHPND